MNDSPAARRHHHLVAAASLLLTAAASRLLPHPPNFTAVPAMALFGSSTAAGFTMSFAPMTSTTSVFGKSGLIVSISCTRS